MIVRVAQSLHNPYDYGALAFTNRRHVVERHLKSDFGEFLGTLLRISDSRQFPRYRCKVGMIRPIGGGLYGRLAGD